MRGWFVGVVCAGLIACGANAAWAQGRDRTASQPHHPWHDGPAVPASPPVLEPWQDCDAVVSCLQVYVVEGSAAGPLLAAGRPLVDTLLRSGPADAQDARGADAVVTRGAGPELDDVWRVTWSPRRAPSAPFSRLPLDARPAVIIAADAAVSAEAFSLVLRGRRFSLRLHDGQLVVPAERAALRADVEAFFAAREAAADAPAVLAAHALLGARVLRVVSEAALSPEALGPAEGMLERALAAPGLPAALEAELRYARLLLRGRRYEWRAGVDAAEFRVELEGLAERLTQLVPAPPIRALAARLGALEVHLRSELSDARHLRVSASLREGFDAALEKGPPSDVVIEVPEGSTTPQTWSCPLAGEEGELRWEERKSCVILLGCHTSFQLVWRSGHKDRASFPARVATGGAEVSMRLSAGLFDLAKLSAPPSGAPLRIRCGAWSTALRIGEGREMIVGHLPSLGVLIDPDLAGPLLGDVLALPQSPAELREVAALVRIAASIGVSPLPEAVSMEGMLQSALDLRASGPRAWSAAAAQFEYLATLREMAPRVEAGQSDLAAPSLARIADADDASRHLRLHAAGLLQRVADTRLANRPFEIVARHRLGKGSNSPLSPGSVFFHEGRFCRRHRQQGRSSHQCYDPKQERFSPLPESVARRYAEPDVELHLVGGLAMLQGCPFLDRLYLTPRGAEVDMRRMAQDISAGKRPPLPCDLPRQSRLLSILPDGRVAVEHDTPGTPELSIVSHDGTRSEITLDALRRRARRASWTRVLPGGHVLRLPGMLGDRWLRVAPLGEHTRSHLLDPELPEGYRAIASHEGRYVVVMGDQRQWLLEIRPRPAVAPTPLTQNGGDRE